MQATTQPLAAYGVRFTVPANWSVRVLPPGGDGGHEYWGLNVHAATLAVPLDDDSTFGSSMMGALGPLDIGFALNEFTSDAGAGVVPGQGIWAAAKPANLTLQDFNPASLQVTRKGQLGVQRSFTANGRAMSFYIVLGSQAAAASNLAGLNAILSTFGVASAVDATNYA